MTGSIYDFAIKTIAHGELNFASLQGKVVLITNVASKCGYTKQYAGLEALSKKYSEQLVLLGFPCNQFGAQEPGTESEILDFCTRTFNVSFPLSTKVDVNGPNTSPVFQFLKSQTDGKDIRWNFEKFLIGKDGSVVGRFGSGVTPEELDAKVEELLAK
ncbi:hypothetical protein HDU76_001765 [Blyttiomyces sp. JEL0837]|nr:hypothetical protein HDU76_001765 [Blyttiomyces sp. JEL0837]